MTHAQDRGPQLHPLPRGLQLLGGLAACVCQREHNAVELLKRRAGGEISRITYPRGTTARGVNYDPQKSRTYRFAGIGSLS